MMRVERQALIGPDLRRVPGDPGDPYGGYGTGTDGGFGFGFGVTGTKSYKIGDIIQQYPDGTALIVTNLDYWGNPITELRDISPPSGGGGSSSAPTVYGEPYVTEMGGRQVLVQDTNYGPQFLSAWDNPAAAEPSYYGGNIPEGFIPIYDNKGNIIDIRQDPNYVSDWQKQQDIDANMGIINQKKYYNESLGLEKDKFSYQKEQDAISNAQLLAEFDWKKQNAIDERAADMDRLTIELASLEKRADQDAQVRREEIRGRLQVAQAQMANDMAIAQLDAGTRLKVAQMEQALGLFQGKVAQRGQDIDAGVAVRGQDIGREGNILGAKQGLLQFASTLDPVRASIALTGGSGGTTPFEYAADEFRRSIPAMPVIKDFVMPKQITGLAGGGSVPNVAPQVRLVGERGPELMVVRPDRTDVIPIQGLAEGGSVETPEIPAPPAGFDSWSAVLARLQELVAKKATSHGYGSAGLYNLMKKLPKPLRSMKASAAIAKIQEWTTVAAPAPPAPPPPEITPEDAFLIPAAPSTPQGLQEARDTIAGQLQGIAAGNATQRYDFNLEPIYGVEMGRPQDYASNYFKMPKPSRDLLTSAFRARNIEPEVFHEIRQKYTPVALQPRTFGWG